MNDRSSKGRRKVAAGHREDHRVAFAPALPAMIFMALSGCSSSSTGAAPTPGFSHDIVLSMALTVPPAAELHQCQLMTLPNSEDVEAISFSHQYTSGSHHFLVIATDLDVIPSDLQGQYDCTNGNEPIMAHARAVIYGAQTPVGNFPLPAGVGVRMTAKQVVIMQTHYLNPSPDPIAAKVDFGVDTARVGATQEEAGFMFFYDPFIYLPPQSTASSGLRCGVPDAVNVITASSHYHQRGMGMKVWLDEPGGESQTPFYETHDWEHPTNFQGPFALPAGSTVRFRCDYANTETTEIFQGPNAKTSEMCVFGGLYYPKGSANFEQCQPISVLGLGASACGDLTGCYRACTPGSAADNAGDDLRQCREKCFVSGCPGATDALIGLLSCAGATCGTECAAVGATCDACLAAKCGSQLDACLTHTCAP